MFATHQLPTSSAFVTLQRQRRWAGIWQKVLSLLFGAAGNKTLPFWGLKMKWEEVRCVMKGWVPADGCKRHQPASDTRPAPKQGLGLRLSSSLPDGDH